MSAAQAQAQEEMVNWRSLLEAGRAIALASDHAGWPLLALLNEALSEANYKIQLFSPPLAEGVALRCDYPTQALPVLDALHSGEACCGLLVCGSGIGISIAANRRAGIRAVRAHEPYSATLARAHNDANILCLGARLCGPAMALETLNAFLDGPFEGGRHQSRVELLDR